MKDNAASFQNENKKNESIIIKENELSSHPQEEGSIITLNKTGKAQHHQMMMMNSTPETEVPSVAPMSRCSSGSSLSTVLSNFSVSSIVRLKPSIHWNNVFQNYSKKFSSDERSPKSKNLPLLVLQLKIMSGVIFSSMLMFMLAMMNVRALIFLLLTSATLVLLGHTVLRYVSLEYEENPRFFFNFLPNSVQTHLTETSIHDYMIQGKNELEEGDPSIYKYLLIYFIPGLSENDLKRLVEEIPISHREILLQPGGIAKMLLPEAVLNVLAPPTLNQTSTSDPNHHTQNQPTPQEAVDSLIYSVISLFPQSVNQKTPEPSFTPAASPLSSSSTTFESKQNIVVNKQTKSHCESPPVDTISLNIPMVQNQATSKSLIHKDHEVESKEVNQHCRTKEEESPNSLITNALSIMITNYSYNAAYNLSRWTNRITEKYVPYVVFGSFGLSSMATLGALGWSYQTGFSGSIDGAYPLNERTKTIAVGYGLISTAFYGSSSAFFAFMLRYFSKHSYLHMNNLLDSLHRSNKQRRTINDNSEK